MSNICDKCGKKAKCIPTNKGEHLCPLCMVKRNLKPKIDFCCRCLLLTPHNECYGRGKRKSVLYSRCMKCRLKTIVKEIPTKEDLISHRKVDLQGM